MVSDRFSAIADDSRDYLQTECGVREPINVVPLGVDVTAFSPDPKKRQRSRDRLGLTPDNLVLLYTGKVVQQKGVHLLVEAAAQLGADIAGVTVLVVGDADREYKRHLQSLASDAQVDIRVFSSVGQEQLPDLYWAADVGVRPRQESMGVFQAMAAGLPTVVSARSGLATMVAPGRGLAYEPDTASALAACLRGLSNQQVRSGMGKSARRFAEAELSWRRSAERYTVIYREALAARASK